MLFSCPWRQRSKPKLKAGKMKETLRLVISLTVIAAIAGFCVALAEAITREPIAEKKRAQFIEDLGEVLPEGLPEPVEIEVTLADGSTRTVHRAGDAVALEVVSTEGYAGDIKLLIGFRGDGILHSYTVLDHKETPGLGAHIAGSYRSAITNRPAATTVWKVRQDGGEIDALTAATISSRAVCDAIAQATEILRQLPE